MRAEGEMILLVEDDDGVREAIRNYLEELGYKVMAAENGEEALRKADDYSGPIHLLLTDVVMPKMSGRELAERLKRRSEMLTLYMSGYTDEAIVNQAIIGDSFIPKPFSLSSLALRLRELMTQS